MSDEKIETIDIGPVKVLWCLDHDDLAYTPQHDECETEWRWPEGTEQADEG